MLVSKFKIIAEKKNKLYTICFLVIGMLLFFSNSTYAALCTCATPATAVPVLAAPTAVTTTSANITWTAAAHCGGITGYSVEVSTTSGGANIAGYPLDLGVVLTSGLTGLSCGTTYFVRVRGELNVSCVGGYTGYSNIRSFTTGACGAATCVDGIQNGTETGIDCGGSCPACVVNCTNGIQDGAETGVDCGGSCPVTCTTNTTTVVSVTGCTTTSMATVYQTTCDQIGTTAYNTNSPNVSLDQANTSVNLPSNINCTNYDGTTSAFTTAMQTTFFNLELDAGVENVNLSEGSLTALGSGNSKSYLAAYQGNACGTLTFVGCYSFVEFSSGLYYYNNVTFSGLNDAQDLYLFAFNDSGKDFTMNYQAVGSNTSDVPNTSCATAAIAGGEGCNLGAPGATWTAPESAGAGVDCGGGVWTSNENTTYYSFTADATTGSLEIDGIVCNDGGSGAAQFGVWTSCAAIGTYGAGFLGCQVGTNPLSLSPLVDGQTYYIAVDGSGGDNCTWGFTGTGIILPIEYKVFKAFHDGNNVLLEWTTSSEINNDYFTIQRTVDGRNYENIGQVRGSGNSNEEKHYEFTDFEPYSGTSYYRIKQTDFNGEFKYTDIKKVTDKSISDKLEIVPNPVSEKMSIIYNSKTRGISTIVIQDITGKVIQKIEVESLSGSNNIEINTEDMKNGLYTLFIYSNQNVVKQKFIKN